MRLTNHLRDKHNMSLTDISKITSNEDSSISEEDFAELSDTDSDTESDTDSDASSSSESDNDSNDEEEEEEEEDDDSNSPWTVWVDDVWDEYEARVRRKTDTLMDDDEYLSKEAATETAIEAYLPDMNRTLRRTFLGFSVLTKRFKKDPMHQKIFETAKRAREEDEMDWEESLAYVHENVGCSSKDF